MPKAELSLRRALACLTNCCPAAGCGGYSPALWHCGSVRRRQMKSCCMRTAADKFQQDAQKLRWALNKWPAPIYINSNKNSHISRASLRPSDRPACRVQICIARLKVFGSALNQRAAAESGREPGGGDRAKG